MPRYALATLFGDAAIGGLLSKARFSLEAFPERRNNSPCAARAQLKPASRFNRSSRIGQGGRAENVIKKGNQ
jgi:hypothetical protein